MDDVEDDWETPSSPSQQTSTATTTSSTTKQTNGPLLMRFCPYDSSMLYPSASASKKALSYACKLCVYREPSTSSLIYVNRLKKATTDVLKNVSSNIVDDPTLARSEAADCSNCGGNRAVFFQSANAAEGNSLKLIFVCCQCRHKWVG